MSPTDPWAQWRLAQDEVDRLRRQLLPAEAALRTLALVRDMVMDHDNMPSDVRRDLMAILDETIPAGDVRESFGLGPPAPETDFRAHIIPFGVHKGRRVQEAPTDYLRWFVRECKIGTGLKAAIEKELARR